MYPIMLNMRGRPCLLVGAGQIAYWKLQRLLSEGAVVTVVAPAVIEPIARLAEEGKVVLHKRPFADSDMDSCQIALAATGDRVVDERLAAVARARGILLNVADVPDLCDFYLPAVVERGELQLCIASGGGAPFAVRRLRQMFERKIGPAWASWIAAARHFRRRVQGQGLSGAVADACYDRFFRATVDEHALHARVPSEAEEAKFLMADADRPQGTVGHVTLVGAGPGNPGLLTVEGLNRLRDAQAVVYDRLAIPAIPLDLPDHIELHYVGKEAGRHPVPQDDINALLVRLAGEGKRVVRLKGGDPFVFARGGEEALVLRRAGIPCDVVPGVTAGIAAPAAAGIPVTYRGQSVRLTFITAHEGGAPQLRWDLLAQDKHGTLVGYMGVSTLAEVSAELIAAGMSRDMPAAVIEQGTLPGQRSVRAPLAEIAKVAATSGIKPPAVFVIGQVVAHADELESATPRPLRGARFAMFAPRSQLSDALEDAGAAVLLVPAPLTKAARLVVGAAPLSGWIIRAEREFDVLDHEKARHGFVAEGPWWCLGGTLAEHARRRNGPTVAEFAESDAPAVLIAKLGQSLAGHS